MARTVAASTWRGLDNAKATGKDETMNVTMKYRLSSAGQMAALLAGRPATAEVTETVDCELNAELLASCRITASGAVELDARSHQYIGVYLDAPPEDVAHLARLFADVKATAAAKEAAVKAEQEQKRAEELAAIEAARDRVDAAIEAGQGERWGSTLKLDGETLPMGRESIARLEQLQKERADAAAAAVKAERDAKIARRAAQVVERGGWVFKVEGGFCAFRAIGIWCTGQSKRWVGLFSAARGVDKFLDNPRGEWMWDVAPLMPGDCIQGGGFDTNSRGKRRNESEFFGVVVEKTETELVVLIVDSRAAALKGRK